MKVKKFVIIFIISILILICPNMANAATVTSEKIVTSTNGSVTFLIKGLELEEGASYEWAIEKKAGAEITNWYEVLAPEYSTGNIKITVSIENNNLLELLKSTDSAYITVRKVGETNTILKDYNVDLSLPLLKAFTVEKSEYFKGASANPAFYITSAYGINTENIQFKWEKITDSNIVNNYIDNNHDLSGLNLKGKEDFPSLSDSSWKTVHSKYEPLKSEFGKILNQELPEEDGLYYIWFIASSTDTKTIYGQAVVDVGEVTRITTDEKTDDDIKTPVTDNKTDDDNRETIKDAKKDDTIAPGILQYTGLEVGIIFAIILSAGIVLFAYFRYNKFKDIK